MESIVVSAETAEDIVRASARAAHDSHATGDIEELAEAFERFTQKAAKLQTSYSKLKRHVSAVNRELEEKNHTLRRKIEELDATRAYLNDVLESMGSGVIAVDTHGRIMTFNAAAEQMTGFRRADVLGRDYTDVFPERDEGCAAILLSLETDAPHVFKERTLERRDGRALPVGVSSSPLRDADGAMTGALEIFHDLTEVKRLEERIRCADRLAALGEMAATVAHEIRNPLGGIEGFAALLERDLADAPAQREMASHIVQGARSLNRIVTGLLDFTRPVELQLRCTCLKEVVDAALAVVEQEMCAAHPRVSVVRDYSEKTTVRVDPEQIYGVVLNLVRNAWQALGAEGRVEVSISARGGEGIAFCVRDTGCGMSDETKRRLFSPFFTTKQTGTGLGLSIVRKVVEAHGGTIEVETAPNEGAAFTVTLPRRPRAA
ncbi:MAG: PAS domain S-box protein [Verrucomicrobia bacterium]|nr:PAS domain S-box protein [Verrucomicrobiota bacterium]